MLDLGSSYKSENSVLLDRVRNYTLQAKEKQKVIDTQKSLIRGYRDTFLIQEQQHIANKQAINNALLLQMKDKKRKNVWKVATFVSSSLFVATFFVLK